MTVLRNDTLAGVHVRIRLVIVCVAVQEHYNIRVLLNGSGFTQVGKQRTFVRTLLRTSRKLRQGDYRDVKLLRHDLQVTGYVRDLDYAIAVVVLR